MQRLNCIVFIFCESIIWFLFRFHLGAVKLLTQALCFRNLSSFCVFSCYSTYTTAVGHCLKVTEKARRRQTRKQRWDILKTQRKWRRDVRHCKLNGVITLIVSGIGTGTRIIGDNRCWPLVPVQVQCERFYIKPYNPFIHVSVPETAGVIKP